MLLLDQTSVLIALETAQAALTSIGTSLTAAFTVVGAAWRPEHSKRLLAAALSSKPGHSISGTPAVQPERISVADQFDRAVNVVESSLQRGAGVRQVQSDANDKLDAVEYSLHRLIDELSSVMPQLERPVYAGPVTRPSHRPADHTALAA